MGLMDLASGLLTVAFAVAFYAGVLIVGGFLTAIGLVYGFGFMGVL